MQSIKRLCLVLILLIFTLFATGTMMAGQVLAADWYDPDWGYRKMITIDSTKVPNTDQSNFPVLINTTDVDWRDTVNGGQVAQSDGGDILFTDSDGTTKLSHEIEKYDPSTGELVAWVEVPTVTASSDTDIYIYYGNSTGGLAEWNVNGTWDEGGSNNFKLVQHLQESPNDGVAGHIDSSANPTANNGTPQNFQNAGSGTTDATGQINGADDFAGDDDSVNLGNISDLNFDKNTPFSLSAWVKRGGTDINQTIIGKIPDWQFWQGWYLGFNPANKIRLWMFVTDCCGMDGFAVSTQSPFTSTTNWYYVAATYNGSNSYTGVKIYVNGIEQSTNNWGTTIQTSILNSEPASIGSRENAAGFFNGLIDEVRVSNIVRSPNWITASYNNQSSPSTFYTVDSEESFLDLIVSYLSIPKVRKNRRGHIAKVFVDYRVMNQGTEDASVASELDFYLSRDTVLDGSDTYVGTVNIPALAPGEETHRLLNAKRFKLSRPVFSSGTWYLLGVADAGDDNVESDETNNVTAVLVTGSGR